MKNFVSTFRLIFVGLLLTSCLQSADKNTDLFKSVEKLNIGRKGYVIGAALNKQQKQAANDNPLQASASGTYKFNDNGLNIVADKHTDRVVVLYEQFENATQKQVQDLVGELFMEFESPTISAHDSVVYWAYDKNGKISTKAYEHAKEEKKKLEILATVKLNSDIKIMEKSGGSSINGSFYYIISSDPLLEKYKKQ